METLSKAQTGKLATVQIGHDDFKVKSKAHSITLDEEFEKVENELAPLELSESFVGETASAEYVYKTYLHSYGDFDLYVSNAGYNLKNRDVDTYTVTQITLKSGYYRTAKEIEIGSKRDEVVAAYGSGAENPKGTLEYTVEDRKLEITIDEKGFVTGVTMWIEA